MSRGETETPKTPIEILSARGSEKILEILWKRWEDSRKGKGTPGATFTELVDLTKCSSATVSRRLEELAALGLVEKKPRRVYLITELGVLVYQKILGKLQMLGARAGKRNYLEFDQRSDARAWPREGCSIVSGTEKELLITTRRFRSLLDSEKYEDIYNVVKGAVNRGVRIYVLADPSIRQDVREIITKKFNGELKCIDSKLLENPPGILKPIFLDDFSHVMIADRRHWLALRPHEREDEHSGKRCLNDPITAGYLSEIFWTFWELADYISKSSERR